MRFQLLSLLMLSCGISAGGATLENFAIVNSSSLSFSGGEFTSGGGGAYSGSFRVDTSQIPPDGSRTEYGLTSWDIVVTGAGQPAFDLEFDPANGNGSFIAQTEESFNDLGLPSSGFAQVDSVLFQRVIGQDVFQLTLSMIEPAGLFHGGVVLDATDTETSIGVPPFQTSISDVLGTGLVVDPAVLAPEPGCELLLAIGLGVMAAIRRR